MLPKPIITEEAGIYIIFVDGMYESSMLITGFLDTVEISIVGEMIIGVPSRDMLLIVDSNDKDALNILAGFTQDYYELTSYPISGRLMQYVDNNLSWYR